MTRDTRAVILETAEFLIRTRGYSAFSYADLAESAGITKASVHYHFPTKQDLAAILISEFIERLRGLMADIRERHPGASAQLRAYADLFHGGFLEGMLPFCGSLAAERAALPPALHPLVHDLFQLQLDWIAEVLENGRAAGTIHPDISPEQMATVLLSVFEGAVFIGWGLQQKVPVSDAFKAILRSIEKPGPE